MLQTSKAASALRISMNQLSFSQSVHHSGNSRSPRFVWGGYASTSILHINGRALHDVPTVPTFNCSRGCHVIGARLTSTHLPSDYDALQPRDLVCVTGPYRPIRVGPRDSEARKRLAAITLLCEVDQT